MADKMIRLSHIFTPLDIAKGIKIVREKPHNLHQRLRDEVVAAVMPRINDVTGQENDADYVAYLLEYALTGEPT